MQRGDCAGGRDLPSISAPEWADFTGRFLAADGRIVDREGGGVTHSEGQGYGMLLVEAAVQGEAPAAVEDGTVPLPRRGQSG